MKPRIDKTIIILLVLSLLAIAESVFIANQIFATSANITKIHNDIKAEDVRRSKLEELIIRYAEIQKEEVARDITELLPNTNNFLDVIREIESLGKLSGTKLVVDLGNARLTADGFELPQELRNKSIIGRTLPAGAKYDFLEIEISVRGTYAQLTQFINLFDQSKYFMNITSMNINRVAVNNKSFIDAGLTVEVFVQKVIYTNVSK
jgi:Tfp pilus assembly protein PilO